MAQTTPSNGSKKFTKIDNNKVILAITKKFNDSFRKDEKALSSKAIGFNNLVKLASEVDGLKATLNQIVLNDDIPNLSTWRLNRVSLEIGEKLSKHFDTKDIDLGADGKKEDLAKKIIEGLNSIYKSSIKEDSTPKQVKMVDVADLFNAKGIELPSIKNLDTTIKFSKAKIIDLSDKAVDTLINKLGGK